MLRFILSVILITLILQQLAADSTHCIKQCGEFKIENPFGMGPNCSRDDYYAISCKKPPSSSSSSSRPKPFLTKLDLEIVDIKMYFEGYGYAMVNMPVTRACANDNKTETKWRSVDLSGSPYYLDPYYNVFASTGCHGLASMYNDTSFSSGRKISGCSSTCTGHDDQKDRSLSCDGYRCCQSKIHPTSQDSRVYGFSVGVSLIKSDDENGGCRSGFVISRDFLNSNSSVISNDFVPVQLLWEFTVPQPDVHYTKFFLVLGSLIVSCGCIWLWWFCKTKETRKEAKLRAKYFKTRLEQNSFEGEVTYKTKLFPIRELKKATDNFNGDRILGQGAQGIVYKGMLTNGQTIAVKRSLMLEEGQWKKFINEVIILSQVNHRNVVRLLGCCLETKQPLLVYEFIPNGTLSQHIHNPGGEFFLTFDMRLRIASEIAGAVAYLHSSSTTPIYHRDIKSNNILLDDKFRVRVSDFGISKVVSMDQTHLTTSVQGTIGYLDPEYFRSSQFSEKSDVYSFGVILVELLTGQHAIRVTTLKEERSLVMYFLSAMNESNLEGILDPLVIDGSTQEEVMVVANLAKSCLNSSGIERPTMKEVTIELEGLRRKLPFMASPNRIVSLEIGFATSSRLSTLMTDNSSTTSTTKD